MGREGVEGAEGGAENPLVAVDGVVGDGVGEVLEVHADLVRAAGDGEAADDGVAGVGRGFPGLASIVWVVGFGGQRGVVPFLLFFW